LVAEMFWIPSLYDAVIDAARSVVDAIESLLVRLANPKAHAWIAANGDAVILHERGMLDEAAPAYDRALRLARESGRPRRIAITLMNMAILELRRERLREASEHLVEALAIQSKEFGPDHRETATTRRRLAVVYSELGESARAAELYAATLERVMEQFGPDSGEVAEASLRLAMARDEAGELAEAERLYRSAAAAAERLAGPRATVTATYVARLGGFLAARERWAEAEPVLVRARDIWDMVGDEAALTPTVERLIAVYRALDRRDEAVAAVNRFARSVSRFRERDRGAVASALELQVEVLTWAGGDDETARRLARRAAILRAADERDRQEEERSETRRREAMRPVVDTVAGVLADAQPKKT